MPEVFRDAATSPGGVMSFVTTLEDEAFRTGNRTEVEAQRWNVQGMIIQIDRFRDKDLLLADVAKWLLPSAERGRPGADKGVNAAASYAYAEMLDSAARLYDRPDLAARAASICETLTAKGFARPVADVSSERAALAARVREELAHEIRPGGVDGQAFWNGNAQMFMYPPAFSFQKVRGAVRYRFQVMDDQQYAHTFEAEAPTVSLKPVWEFVPRGLIAVFCFGLGGDGEVCGLAGQRRFWKKAPFEPGVYPRAKRPYAEAQKMLCDYILNLPEATGEAKYLEAARRIAETYIRLQGADGTWYLKVYEKDGKPVSGNRLVPMSVINFLETLYAATGDEKYRTAADRAFAFIDDGPLRTWNWEGQFEDIRPAESRYQNLTKHNACDTAIYMLKRFPGDRKRLAQAREIVRYAEDQFVLTVQSLS